MKQKNPIGRPKKYNPIYCKQMLEYFDVEPYEERTMIVTHKNGTTEEKYVEVPAKLPTFERFAVSIGVHRETLINWTKEFPDFFDTYKKAKDYQKDIVITNGLRGNYEQAFAIFTAKNVTDMRDKNEVEHSGGIKTEYGEAELNERIDKYLALRVKDLR